MALPLVFGMSTLSSVANFDFGGNIRKSSTSNSITYRPPNSRKSNFMATCPFCRGGSLRIFTAMTQESVITRILRHCKLAFVPPPIAPARLRQETFDRVASAHDVARGLESDVCAVARCLRPEEPSKSRLK